MASEEGWEPSRAQGLWGQAWCGGIWQRLWLLCALGGSRAPQEGRAGADGHAVRCQAAAPAQVGSQVSVAAHRPWGRTRLEPCRRSLCAEPRVGPPGVRWVWARGRKKGKRDGEAPVVPATSRVSGNVPRPGLVSARELCQAVPARSAAPALPGAGLGLEVRPAGAAGQSGRVWSAPSPGPREAGPSSAKRGRPRGQG